MAKEMKVLYADCEKIVIKIPAVRVDDETLDILIVRPEGLEFLANKEYIRMKGKSHWELAKKQRHKHQDFRDFLIFNKALERVFGLQRDDDSD